MKTENEITILEKPIEPVGSGTAGETGQPATPEQASEQVLSALASANAGNDKKKRGRHPNSCECDRCKERKAAPSGNSGIATFPVETPDTGFETKIALNTPAPVFDRETVEPILQGMVQVIDDFGQNLIDALCQSKGKSDVVTAAARKKAEMKPATKSMVIAGGLGCAKKWQAHFEYIEETAFFGGLLAHGIFLLMAASTIKNSPSTPSPK